jgi:AAA domain
VSAKFGDRSKKGFKIGAEKAANDNLPKAKSPANEQKSIAATPFVAVDPARIPPREWLYDRHYIRKFVSATIAGGGVGKSALKLVQTVSMAIGRDLLDGGEPITRLHVWYWNGEDPKDEIQRRIAAICLYYKIEPKELEGWLFVDSGHDIPICLATEDRGKVSLDERQRKSVGETIACNNIDVVILDPFIAIHRVSENNNPLIDRVLKLLGEIANRENCSIEIVHHIRKPAAGQNEATADDSRGGGAIVNAARSCRVLNRMNSKEAERTPIDQDSRYRYIRVDSGKQNLAPPEKAKWLYLASVTLPNGDNVHVVERWQFPEAVQSWTEEDIQFIGRQVRAKAYRWDTRAKDWIGKVVADRLGLDPENKAGKEDIKAFLRVWEGVIAVEERSDAKRKQREFVVPGPGQSASGSRTGTEGANGDED